MTKSICASSEKKRSLRILGQIKHSRSQRKHTTWWKHLREGFKSEVKYSLRRDYLQFYRIVSLCQLTSTHQAVASQSNSNDIRPHGISVTLTMKMKILFQELCIKKTNCDIKLKGESLRKWKSFLQDLILIDCYRIPCCYFAHQTVDIQLHGLSDAFECA